MPVRARSYRRSHERRGPAPSAAPDHPLVDILPEPPIYSGRMPTRNESQALLQGTLDLLVLRILALGAHHGHGIALAIQSRSGHTLLIDHGSLYPALQRREQSGWIKGAWGTS